jgi:hypothetical protein
MEDTQAYLATQPLLTEKVEKAINQAAKEKAPDAAARVAQLLAQWSSQPLPAPTPTNYAELKRERMASGQPCVDGWISAVTAASTPLWDCAAILRRIATETPPPGPQTPLPLTVVLGHWSVTEEVAARALTALRGFRSQLVFSGGDAVQMGPTGAEEAPLVARGVASLEPALHLAFQHVHYLQPQLAYPPCTLFVPHMAFDEAGAKVHSGFTGPTTAPAYLPSCLPA